MAKEYYIYSTLSNDQAYTTWQPVPESRQKESMARVVERTILVRGKANIADRFFITPRGMVTKVTEEEFEHLKNNEDFIRHEKAGHILVEEKKYDPEVVVAKGMKQADDSAPITPNTVKAVIPGGAKPKGHDD